MPFTLILLSTYFFSSVLLSGFFAAYALSKGNTALVKVFSTLCSLISIYLFGYLLELNSSSLPQMIFWNQIQYIGIPFYPAFWLLLCFIYTKTIKSINKWTLGVIFGIPILTFLIRLTNPLHYLYYRSLKLKTLLGLNFLSLDKGPWYYFYSAYLIFYFFLSIYSYVKSYPKRAAFQRDGYRIMILASLLPCLGLILILVDPGNLGINYIAPLLPFSMFLILLVLFKYDFLELKTLAREVIFERSTDAMLLIDSTNRLMDFNPAAALLFQELNGPANGRTIESVLNKQISFLEALKTDDKKDLKIAFCHGYGHFEVKTVLIKNDYGNVVGKLINLINITERKHAQEALNILATTDALTGLYNRSQFLQLANLEMERSHNYNSTFSLLMIDIDLFKNINDTKGHAAGDSVLRHLGGEMKDYFRKTDIIGRLGGEEFAVLLPNTGLEDANNITEIFRNNISKCPAIYEDSSIYFTLSIGISVYNCKFKNFDEVLKLADEGLYESKSKGRNTITIKVSD
jgi:diguanylate cyclase (GGDEF)-like protein